LNLLDKKGKKVLAAGNKEVEWNRIVSLLEKSLGGTYRA
jgi:hypothetical protein